MSPNGISSGFDETFSFSSSDSSDSEYLLQEDIKNRENHINKQWEAIERTLYQEPGQQVIDPELLKECKLWRETFPHFRVKGTKINVNRGEKEIGQTDENVQTLGKHFNLKVLEEKREKIKKEIVGALVKRLIPKINQQRLMGLENIENAKPWRNCQSGVQITEISDKTAEKMLSLSPNGLKSIENSDFFTALSTEKESYFERGKSTAEERMSPEALTPEHMEKKLFGTLNSWKGEKKTAIKLPETAPSANPRKLASSSVGNLMMKNSDKSIAPRLKPRNSVPRSDSSSSFIRPLEITKKIDKKYEGLVERIMERQLNGFEFRRHCRTSSSGLEKSYEESLTKLRLESNGFEERVKKKNAAPRINKFSNNWLQKSEQNSYHRSAGDHVFQERTNKSNRTPKSFYMENMSQKEIDERFLEELKKEMAWNCKRPPKKSGVIEEISLRRPKHFSSTTEMTVKSSNSGDLSKKNKKEITGGQSKRGLESESRELSVKSRVKHNNWNGSKGNKRKKNQSSLLPPIETGIICTELTGRPKIGPKNSSKKL